MMADYKVVGPKAKGPQFAFGEIEDPADLRLDYNTSILPPKKYLQPPEERMMTLERSIPWLSQNWRRSAKNSNISSMHAS